MRTTYDDRKTFEELASAFVADARELRVLREELRGLSRLRIKHEIFGRPEVVDKEYVLWSDVLALLDGEEE